MTPGEKPRRRPNGTRTAYVHDYLRRLDAPPAPAAPSVGEQLGVVVVLAYAAGLVSAYALGTWLLT